MNLIRPSFQHGFAKSRHEAAFPHLWTGLRGAWIPAMGRTGTQLLDLSPHKNHGTLTNMTVADWVMKNGEQMLRFNGTNAYVNLAINDTLKPLPGITMFARLTTDGTNNQEAIICCDDGSFNDYELYVKDTGSGRGLFMRIVNVPNQQQTFTYNFTPTVNRTYTYAGTWHAGNARLYVDGVRVLSTTGGSGNLDYPGVTDIRIGSDASGVITYLGFDLAALYLWDRALTYRDITLLHAGASPFALRTDDFGFVAAGGAIVQIENSNINIADSLIRRNRSVRLDAETVNIADALNRRNRSVRLDAETVNVEEGAVRRLTSIRLAGETINIVDSLIRRLRSVRIASTTINISEAANRAAGFVKLAAETINISEAANRAAGFVKLAAETINIVEGAVRRLTSVRFISETINIADSLIRRARAVRLFSTTLNISEAANRTAGFVKFMAETINISAALARVFGVTTGLVSITLKGLYTTTATLKGLYTTITTLKGRKDN